MKLITKILEKQTPRLYETEDFSDELKIVQFKLFDCMSKWTWYIIEYCQEEKLAFGLVDGQEQELGYISISELESLGWRIERDLNWQPRSLAQLKKEITKSKFYV